MRPGASEDIEGTGELGRRELLWRRYFPVGLGAACLGMFIGFFPSTLPAAVGGLTGLGAAPAPPAVSPAVAGAGGIAAPAIAAAGPLLLDLGSAQPVTSDVPSEVTPVPGTNAGTDTTPAGGNPGAPGSSLIPSTPGCPIPLTTTGTQADAVLSQLQALCTIVVSLVSSLGPVPGASLPAGTPAPPALPSAASATGASHSVAPIWLAVDGAPGPGHPHGPLAVLGMVAGTAAPPALSAAVASVTKAGGTVVLLLAPVTGASLAAFPAWTASTTAALAGVSTAGIVVGAVPSTTVTALADAVASALSAVRHERPHTTIAPWWADGGGTPADAPLARALAAATAGLHD
jgi:hypothetical protein